MLISLLIVSLIGSVLLLLILFIFIIAAHALTFSSYNYLSRVFTSRLFYLIILFFSINLIVLSTEWDFSSAERFISNGTVVYFSHKLLIGSLWFIIGFFSYLYLLPKSVILKIKSLSFLELFIILFTILILKLFLESLIYEYVASLINESSLYNWMSPGKQYTCGSPTLTGPLFFKFCR